MKVKALELLFLSTSPFFNKRQISYHLLFYLNNVPKMNIWSQFFLEQEQQLKQATFILLFFAKSFSLFKDLARQMRIDEHSLEFC